MSDRATGYYWVCRIGPEPYENDPSTIAKWDGEAWSFIGTPYLLDDYELKLANCVVVRQVSDPPPTSQDVQRLFERRPT